MKPLLRHVLLFGHKSHNFSFICWDYLPCFSSWALKKKKKYAGFSVIVITYYNKTWAWANIFHQQYWQRCFFFVLDMALPGLDSAQIVMLGQCHTRKMLMYVSIPFAKTYEKGYAWFDEICLICLRWDYMNG